MRSYEDMTKLENEVWMTLNRNQGSVWNRSRDIRYID